MKRLIPLALLLATLLAACVKHDEIDFRGQVVFVQQCSLTVSPSAAGYAVQLQSPEAIGVSFDYLGEHYDNMVLLFDPGCILKVGDNIRGTFYLDDKASRQYCDINSFNNLDIPQGIMLETDVE
ncbi:MAG: hypothetical protein J6I49_07250 [Bacteroidales bacterium]|nr:hypothetical protein [Bacteroidales bacterium]